MNPDDNNIKLPLDDGPLDYMSPEGGGDLSSIEAPVIIEKPTVAGSVSAKKDAVIPPQNDDHQDDAKINEIRQELTDQPVSPAGADKNDPEASTSKDIRERFPEIKAWSFAEAESGQKGFGRDFVINAINGIDANGRNFFLKYNLDHPAVADKSEFDMSKSPSEITGFHKEVVDLVAANLSLGAAGSTEEGKQYLRFCKQKYVERLRLRTSSMEEVYRQKLAGQNPREFFDVFRLDGLEVGTNGKTVDVASFDGDKIDGIRSNIRIQSEVGGGQFVHWETNEVTKAKLVGQEVKIDKRIYLNPQTADLVNTFSTLMQSFNELGIMVQGKMLDRSTELALQLRSNSPQGVRADAIVLAFGDKDADQVLEKVLSLYQSNPTIFEGRPTPKIPFKIAPGIAVGAEPIQSGESLSSHRTGLIEDILSQTRNSLGIMPNEVIPKGSEDRAIQVFNSTFMETSRKNGVNPNNLAFNL